MFFQANSFGSGSASDGAVDSDGFLLNSSLCRLAEHFFFPSKFQCCVALSSAAAAYLMRLRMGRVLKFGFRLFGSERERGKVGPAGTRPTYLLTASFEVQVFVDSRNTSCFPQDL